MLRHRIGIALWLSLALLACGKQEPSTSIASSNTTPTNNPPPLNQRTGDLTALSDAEYAALTAEQKYVLANKLLATVYKGVAVQDFFDLGAGLTKAKLKIAGNYVAQTRTALATPLGTTDRNLYLTNADTPNFTYFVNTNPLEMHYFGSKPMTYPLASIYVFPVSADLYTRWMAYTLANTIMFSPAFELESTNSDDIENVYNRLVSMIEAGQPIREIVYAYMTSQENWHRFRSPEDNTREVMEIFLARFIDAEVPKAATACKNWSITYTAAAPNVLTKSTNVNTVPQQILNTVVVTCENFYRAVADHDDLIPTVATVLINTFFTDASADTKRKLVQSLLATAPKTFNDMFSAILFSKEYLLFTAQTKRTEENIFGVAARIQWQPAPGFFDELTNITNLSPGYVSLMRMSQAPFNYKLGRSPKAPTDTLNFSLHHKLMRERVLLNQKIGSTDNEGWAESFISNPSVNALSNDDFIHYLFLSVITRKATAAELAKLTEIVAKLGYTAKPAQKARVVLDYLSRLPELYALQAVIH